MATLSVADVLDKAADLIEPEGAWTQEYMARDADGYLASVRSEKAVRFCAMGAIRRVNRVGEDAALSFLKLAIGKDNVARWNDSIDRTQAEVVAALRQAATLSRNEQPL
jgi:hypothetical protein